MILIIDPNFRPMTSKYHLTDTTHPAPNHSHSTLKWCFWRSSTQVQQPGVLMRKTEFKKPSFYHRKCPTPPKKTKECNIYYTQKWWALEFCDSGWKRYVGFFNSFNFSLLPLENQKWQWKYNPLKMISPTKKVGHFPANHVEVFPSGGPKNSQLLHVELAMPGLRWQF